MSGPIDQDETGSLEAFDLRRGIIDPFPVPGIRFVRYHLGLAGPLAQAMGEPEHVIHERRATGSRAAVAILADSSVAAYAWISFDAIRILELDLNIPIPRGHAYIWDCATVRAERGRGIFTGLLRFMLEDTRQQGYVQVWAGVAPGNTPSLRAFQRAGFHIAARVALAYHRIEAFPTEAATDLELATVRALTHVGHDEP